MGRPRKHKEEHLEDDRVTVRLGLKLKEELEQMALRKGDVAVGALARMYIAEGLERERTRRG